MNLLLYQLLRFLEGRPIRHIIQVGIQSIQSLLSQNTWTTISPKVIIGFSHTDAKNKSHCPALREIDPEDASHSFSFELWSLHSIICHQLSNPGWTFQPITSLVALLLLPAGLSPAVLLLLEATAVRTAGHICEWLHQSLHLSLHPPPITLSSPASALSFLHPFYSLPMRDLGLTFPFTVLHLPSIQTFWGFSSSQPGSFSPIIPLISSWLEPFWKNWLWRSTGEKPGTKGDTLRHRLKKRGEKKKG